MLGKDAVVLGLAGVIGVLACSERGESGRRICPAPGPNDPPPFTGGIIGITGAASDAWAIGERRAPEGTFERRVLVHWDGCDWRPEASPFDATPGDNWLALSASGRDVWLSGYLPSGWSDKYGQGCPATGGRVFRRRGGRWQQIDRSSTGARKVYAIQANGPDDAWMLENPCNASGYAAATLRHWDGKAVVDLGDPPGIRAPNALWSSGPRDVWVGGEGGVAHWDGGAWHWFSIEKERIQTIAGGGASDVWACGTRVHYWDGSRWTEPSQTILMPKTRGTGIQWLGAAPGGHTFATDYEGNIYRSERAALPVIGRLQGPVTGLPSAPWWWQSLAGGRDDFILFLGREAHRPEMRWSNRKWTVLAPELTGDKGEAIVALWADGAANLWAAVSFRLAPGNRAGEIRRWNGRIWDRAATLEQFPNRFWGLTPDDVWLVGLGGATWHWDGKQWKSVPTDTAEPLYAIWGSNPKDVWAGGASGTVLRWDGAAWRHWSTLNAVENSTTVVSVFGVGADFVLGVGSSHVARWDGKGWALSDRDGDGTIGQNTTAALRGVWASSPTDIWLVGTGGDIQYADTDRRSYTVLPTPLIVHGDGQSWKRVVVGSGSRLRAITGTAANDVWTVGEEGTVLHWNGEDWSSVKSGTEANLLAVAKAADGAVWIGGEGGFLRRLP